MASSYKWQTRVKAEGRTRAELERELASGVPLTVPVARRLVEEGGCAGHVRRWAHELVCDYGEAAFRTPGESVPDCCGVQEAVEAPVFACCDGALLLVTFGAALPFALPGIAHQCCVLCVKVASDRVDSRAAEDRWYLRQCDGPVTQACRSPFYFVGALVSCFLGSIVFAPWAARREWRYISFDVAQAQENAAMRELWAQVRSTAARAAQMEPGAPTEPSIAVRRAAASVHWEWEDDSDGQCAGDGRVVVVRPWTIASLFTVWVGDRKPPMPRLWLRGTATVIVRQEGKGRSAGAGPGPLDGYRQDAGTLAIVGGAMPRNMILGEDTTLVLVDVDVGSRADEGPNGSVVGKVLLRGVRGVFPSDVRVDTFDAQRCPGLEAVPAKCDIVHIVRCPLITGLPAGLRSLRSVRVSECPAFADMPDGLSIATNLTIVKCPALEELPQGLSVGEGLTLYDCPKLATIPRLVGTVGWADFARLPSLVWLPPALTVERNLSVESCNALMGLPEDLVVNGDLLVSDCDNLVFIPPHLRLGRRQGQGPPNAQPDDDAQDAQDQDAQDQEQRASDEVAIGAELGVDLRELRPCVDPAHFPGVMRFLSLLLDSAEFQDEALRPELLKRVQEVLALVGSDPLGREAVVLRMLDAIDACEDKPVWALGQMQVMAAAAHARGDRAKLRALGRRVMRLGVVHEHARRFVLGAGDESDDVDDVSVYLTFEISLREALDLPVSSSASHYSEPIPQSALDAAREEALGVSDAAFDEWLAAWPEWVRQERADAVVAYADLRESSAPPMLMRLTDDGGAVDVRGEIMLDPVHVLPDSSTAWSYADVVGNWVRTGRDLANNDLPAASFADNVLRLRVSQHGDDDDDGPRRESSLSKRDAAAPVPQEFQRDP